MESEVKTVFKRDSRVAKMSAGEREKTAENVLRNAATRIRGVMFMKDCDLRALSDNLAEAASQLRDAAQWEDASGAPKLQARAARLSQLSSIAEDLDDILTFSKHLWPEDK